VHALERDAPIVVDAQGVSKAYANQRLFDAVDLTVRAGEIVAVTGPSGCGKTTLGHVLLGLTPADAGHVRWPGPTRAWARHKLYQDPPSAFAPHRQLRAALDDLVRRHRLDPAEIGQHMRSLKLGDHLLDRLPGEVSGGELQRLALLRVLMLRPEFLFADEPTSRLDPITQQRTMELMCRLAQEWRFGLMLVTHDLEMARKAAHRIQTVAFAPALTS
jgi:ABC-type dipeptide/oligopeptide/nickel transport system ATPase subunit